MLGIVFSILGLQKAKQMNGEGRGMALAGLWISIIYMVVSFIIFIFYWQWLMDLIGDFGDPSVWNGEW